MQAAAVPAGSTAGGSPENDGSEPVVAVVGSREFPQLERVRSFVRRLAEKYPSSVIVSGGARGVDHAAEEAALEAGLGLISYRPYEYDSIAGHKEWSIETHTEGARAMELVVAKSRRISPPYFPTFAAAAYARNAWIVDDATRVVAFTIGSPGTASTIQLARSRSRPLYVYRPSDLAERSPDSLLGS